MNLEEKSEILLKEIDRQYELLTLRDQDISYWESYYISLENNRSIKYTNILIFILFLKDKQWINRQKETLLKYS